MAGKTLTSAHKELSGIDGIKVFRNASLRLHNTFRIGGKADLLVIPKNEKGLLEALSVSKRFKIKTIVIGNGSNILFSDKGFRGIVVKLATGLNELKIEGRKVTAGAGVILSALIKASVRKGLGGLEFAYGVPATVGGAVVMNFGARGSQLCDVVDNVTVAGRKLDLRVLKKNSMRFGYRTSSLMKSKLIVTRVCLKLRKKKTRVIKNNLRRAIDWRRDKQPLGIPNAGCVFKNPRGKSAGQLIEAAGLAGKRVGDAQVSTKHSNFVVNLGSARASDVLTLMKKMRKAVYSRFGVTLVPEIRAVKP